MGVVFALFLLVAYGLIFNSVQANAVSRALHFAFNIPPLISGIALAFCALLIIIRGIKGVARLMQWLIPLIALLWVAGSVFICLWHIEQMPGVIASDWRIQRHHYHLYRQRDDYPAGGESRVPLVNRRHSASPTCNGFVDR